MHPVDAQSLRAPLLLCCATRPPPCRCDPRHLPSCLFLSFSYSSHRFGEVLNIQLRQAPTGPDRWALVTFAQPHSALAAMHSLNHLHLPNLTHTELKIRLWDERPQQQPPPPPPQQQQPWRQDSGQQHAAWADAEDEGQAPASAPAPTAMRRTVGGGWVAEEEARDEEDPLVELWVGNLHSSATRLSVRRAFEW